MPPFRNKLRDRFFDMFHRTCTHDVGKAALADGLQGLLNGHPCALPDLGEVSRPYEDVGQLTGENSTASREDIVFVTGRFRSGSTLLWNIFRHLDEVTAYYEPLNERRWFDVSTRGERVDGTHRGVTDYWREYDGLGKDLSSCYREDWIRRNLYMDERFWDPALKRYIELLVERAGGRPVLQFNRLDFRLPWVRATFPNARIVHLMRHPRDQWCSSLLDLNRFGPCGGSLADFKAQDGFYLCAWVKDLQYHFPFLADEARAHPYRCFYLLWKLSYLFAHQYADMSLRLEDLVEHPQTELERLFALLSITVKDWSRIESLVERPSLSKWKQYADEDWFRHHEVHAEGVIADFLRKSRLRSRNIETVSDR